MIGGKCLWAVHQRLIAEVGFQHTLRCTNDPPRHLAWGFFILT